MQAPPADEMERCAAAGWAALQSSADSMLKSSLPSSHRLLSRDTWQLLSARLPRLISMADTQLERRESWSTVPMHSDTASSDKASLSWEQSRSESAWESGSGLLPLATVAGAAFGCCS